MIRAYIKYLLKARDAHSLHSPFVFDLYSTIIRPDNPEEQAFVPIHALQQELLKDDHRIQITDFGAGSRINSARERAIRDIAKNSQKPERFGRLMYRLIRRFGSQVIVDLGTSLGITTLHEAAAAPSAQILTFEGCPQTAAVAARNFQKLNRTNVEIITGNIDQTLPERLKTVPKVDFAFFDANHRYEPTVRYFETCLSKAHNDTCFIFDDIHWSEEMEQAWATIKAHPSVTVSIDLFYIGLVFFRSQQPKQDFILTF
ncbi:O-methyltransferase [Larkinella rosea]|uniref:Class I SAM-dependent methyltransferase n=1 Tax=Larkinella rosea TaxID=2025312 RepID=A0A3P1C058_9BACT|nr:class I SAM-dependent methyltransferase [Larkinella rosea]RRB06790.1 class I SAM-dependent methyltransferase [Larkinella rosea]